MLAAGGLIALILAGFLIDGMMSPSEGIEDENTTNAGSDTEEAADETPTPTDGDLLAPEGDAAEDDAAGDGAAEDEPAVDDAEDGVAEDATGQIRGSGLADLLFGTDEADQIDAEGGDDTVAGGAGDDVIDGGAGDDTLAGQDGSDTLAGGDGDDHLIMGALDHGIGGTGADIFQVSSFTDVDGQSVACVEDFQAGIDRLILEFEGADGAAPEISFDTHSDPGNLLVLANGTPVTVMQGLSMMHPQDVEVLMVDPNAPDPEDQVIEGDVGPDTLVGGAGDDTIDGYAGDDLLDGGTGDDLLRGREGMDSLFGSGGNDAITGGIGDDLLSGGADGDVLFGNDGDDTVGGDDGNDEIYGDEGNDIVSGGAGNDSVEGGDDADLIFGNDGDDFLSGQGGGDFLQGGFGADTLSGGGDDDRLDGTFSSGMSSFGPFDEDEGDVLIGGDGNDSILIGVEDTAMGGAGADVFAAGNYIAPGATAGTVEDFDPNEDMIEILYDPSITPNPNITFQPNGSGTATQVLFDGQVVLNVEGAPSLSLQNLQMREVDMGSAAAT